MSEIRFNPNYTKAAESNEYHNNIPTDLQPMYDYCCEKLYPLFFNGDGDDIKKIEQLLIHELPDKDIAGLKVFLTPTGVRSIRYTKSLLAQVVSRTGLSQDQFEKVLNCLKKALLETSQLEMTQEITTPLNPTEEVISTHGATIPKKELPAELPTPLGVLKEGSPYSTNPLFIRKFEDVVYSPNLKQYVSTGYTFNPYHNLPNNLPNKLKEFIESRKFHINDSYPPANDGFGLSYTTLEDTTVLAIYQQLLDDGRRPTIGISYYTLYNILLPRNADPVKTLLYRWLQAEKPLINLESYDDYLNNSIILSGDNYIELGEDIKALLKEDSFYDLMGISKNNKIEVTERDGIVFWNIEKNR